MSRMATAESLSPICQWLLGVAFNVQGIKVHHSSAIFEGWLMCVVIGTCTLVHVVLFNAIYCYSIFIS